MTQLRLVPYTLMGAPLGAVNPLPVFRNPDPDFPFQLLGSVPLRKREWAGWQASFRVLPYRMQDHYSRERTLLSFQAVELRREGLQAGVTVDPARRREMLKKYPPSSYIDYRLV